MSPPRGPIRWTLDLFSSVWLGVAILLGLFAYSSIGSAGLPVRFNIFQPGAWAPVREVFDLSELQWFHWWPFDALIALLCVNMIIATLRRIPLNLPNLGAWMVHGGVIILASGSVWYFSTKVEGDAPIARRRVVAQLAGAEPVSFIASPGMGARVGAGDNQYTLQIHSITPDCEVLSGDDADERTYKVSILVHSPTQTFIRDLLAGYPEYTEDLLFSDDRAQPIVRAKKEVGTAIVDDALTLSLEYSPQRRLYLRETAALYLREVGSARWIERPIEKLPRFNDYLSSYDHIWPASGGTLPPLRPLDISVPSVDEADPLPEITFQISDHLRYAALHTRRIPGGTDLDPQATIQLEIEGQPPETFRLAALDPARNSLGGGVLEFRWLASAEALESLHTIRPPTLGITLPDDDVAIDFPITELAADDEALPFTPIEDTGYSFRVRNAYDRLAIQRRRVSLAIVEIRRAREAGDEDPTSFVRWVFEDPNMTRDLSGNEMASHSEPRLIDDAIRMTFDPGLRPALRLVAGPADDELRVLDLTRDGRIIDQLIQPGQTTPLQGGIDLTVLDYSARSSTETRPLMIPQQQGTRQVGVQGSIIRVNVPLRVGVESFWALYHIYPFAGPSEVLRRFPYDPHVLRLSDGRAVEILFSRRSMALPHPVALDDFQVATHVGGFTGETSSILDWTSLITFQTGAGWTDPAAVHMNNPIEHDGLWYFQSQWDPPDAPRFEGDAGSAGLNYTILGAANRNGVAVQLAGCCLAVLGMMYAFYAKPYIKRRRTMLEGARS